MHGWIKWVSLVDLCTMRGFLSLLLVSDRKLAWDLLTLAVAIFGSLDFLQMSLE